MNFLHDIIMSEEIKNADLISVHDAAFKIILNLDDSHNN